MKSVEKQHLAKRINDAREISRKITVLKNSRRKRERASGEFSSCSVTSSPFESRDDQGGGHPFDLSILDVHPRPTTCHPLRMFARPFLSPFVFVPFSLLAPLFPLFLFLLFHSSSSSPLSAVSLTHTRRRPHYFSPAPPSPSQPFASSFFLPRVFCQEPSRAEASRTALKQKRSDVKCDYESCESSSRTRMLR